MAFRNFEDHTETTGQMFLLSSDLLDDDAVNAVCIIRMGRNWLRMQSMRCLPLPTQDCSCHRVAAITEGFDPELHTICVTEFSSSKVIQMRVNNFSDSEPLKE